MRLLRWLFGTRSSLQTPCQARCRPALAGFIPAQGRMFHDAGTNANWADSEKYRPTALHDGSDWYQPCGRSLDPRCTTLPSAVVRCADGTSLEDG